MTVHGAVLWRTWHWKAEGHPLHPSEALKRFKTGRDREGEAPAEPHGARTCRVTAHQEARPPNFFTPSLDRGIFRAGSSLALHRCVELAQPGAALLLFQCRWQSGRRSSTSGWFL